MLKTLSTTALAIALQAMTMATTAQAAQVCTTVQTSRGERIACKNVPHQDNPAPSNSQATPTPTPSEPRPTAPAANTPAEPIAAEQQPAAQLATLRQQAFEGIAQAAALTPLLPSSAGKTTLNIGAATYQGETAIGLSLAHRPTQSLVFSAGISAGQSRRNLVQISAGFQF